MKRLLLLSALLVLAALVAPAAALAASGQTVSGTVTVTGTAGKDELEIEIETFGGFPTLFVTPAATVTSTGGNCSPDVDPQTGRAERNVCRTQTITSLVLNLAGGDDDVEVDDEIAIVQSATANAGPGNDVINVAIAGPRAMNGNDGDDTLRIPGQQATGITTFDGGAGRDSAVYGHVVTSGTGQDLTMTGSLQTNQIQLKRVEPNNTLTLYRTDTLVAIEGIEGTSRGDILTGGASAGTVLTGGEGPDNLIAGSADTTLNGGPGLDQLTGAAGADTLDGGTGIDTFRTGGRDTLLMRDGYAETVECVGGNAVLNDLADAVTNAAGCTSIQTAAAKHKHDTTIAQRRLKVSRSGGTAVKLFCPLQKTEACTGVLRLNKGGRTLASKRYKVARGARKLVRFQLTKRAATRAAAGKVEIRGEEVDDDGRPRAVMRRVPARRKRA